MVKPNAYLQRQQEYINAVVATTERIIKQFMLDTLEIAVYREFGFGYERQTALENRWQGVRHEFQSVIDPDNPECDYMQELMDRELKQIIAGRQELIPCKQRYPELKKIRYGRKNRE